MCGGLPVDYKVTIGTWVTRELKLAPQKQEEIGSIVWVGTKYIYCSYYSRNQCTIENSCSRKRFTIEKTEVEEVFPYNMFWLSSFGLKSSGHQKLG